MRLVPKNAKQSLVDEGWPNRLLKQYAKKLTELNEIKYYAVDNIVDKFKDLADAHYRKLWLSCSTDEKILLYRLAVAGFCKLAYEKCNAKSYEKENHCYGA